MAEDSENIKGNRQNKDDLSSCDRTQKLNIKGNRYNKDDLCQFVAEHRVRTSKATNMDSKHK